MQIMIDIPEEMYKEYMFVNLGRGNGKSIVYNLLKAIKNGRPLPEHHGRLIDADELLNTNIDTFSQQTELKIKFAPTIIEGSESE